MKEIEDEILGLGPLEQLLADPAISDILVNGPGQIYIERHGKLELSPVSFDSNQHLMTIIDRIVSRIGRRIDESSPMVDARLTDALDRGRVVPSSRGVEPREDVGGDLADPTVLDGDVGSIEAGKLADLVVIDGNPLQDLRRSEYVLYTMLGGRLFEAATMNQIAPDPTQREPFFFELEGGDTIHPATQRWIDELKERHGWVH